MAIQINGKKVIHLGSATIPVLKGDKGDEGKQGVQGEQGIAGYTPVKGVDYWDTEDKIQILQEITLEFQQDFDSKVDKEEGKSLSTNDFTNELKKKLEELENYNDTEVRELATGNLRNVSYSANDGVMTFTTNQGNEIKIDLPLELLIESGKYDEATKQIILTLANGNVINIPLSDLIDDFYGKQEIDDLLQEKQDQIDTLTQENLEQAEQIKALDKILPRAEAEGEYINVKDSADYKADLEQFIGNIYQETREGYNLFDGELESGGYSLTNGVETSSADTVRNVNPIELEPSTAYIFSNNGVGVGINVIQYDTNMNFVKGDTVSSNSSFTTESETKYINFFRGTTNSDKIQIQEGTVIKPYEQYGAMPSLSFESPIQTTKGNQIIYDGNKNYLNINTLIEKGVNNTAVVRGIDLYLKPNTFYTISTNMVSDVNSTAGIIPMVGEPNGHSAYVFVTKNKSITSFNSTDDGVGIVNKKTRTIVTDNTGYLFVGVRNQYFSNLNDLIAQGGFIQIEEGTVATDYIEHESQTFNIALPFEMTDKDYIYKKDGKWCKHIGAVKDILNGVNKLFVSKSGTTKNNLFVTNAFNLKILAPASNNITIRHYCNYFEGNKSTDYIYSNDIQASSIRADKVFGIGFGLDSEIDTLEKANNWLKEKNNEGNPMYVITPLETPIEEEITDEALIAQLNEIEDKLKTFEGVTNIYTIAEEGLNPILKIKYVQDAKISNENLQAQIDELKTAIVSLGAV